MKITNAAFLTLAVLAPVACTHNSAADLPPGTYKTSTSATDANGTAHDKNVTTNVSVNADGSKNIDTTTKNSTDPKGLFNKTTDTATAHETTGN
jgi:hypothetical protein